MSITLRIDRTAQVIRSISALINRSVGIGVPGDKSARGETVNNALLAYVHEHGTDTISPRPFLQPTILENRGHIATMFRNAGMFALVGDYRSMDRQLNAIGLQISALVKLKIVNGPFIELSDRTIAARRARGNLSIKPLIDTSQMLNAISYAVRRRHG